MEWTIEHREAPGPHIVMKVSGRFTLDEVRRGIAELATVKDPLTPLLFDDRDVDFAGTSDLDLIRIGGIFGEYRNTFAFSRIAVLVDGDHARGIAEKWRRVTQGPFDSLIAVFEDETEAITWLTERSESDVDQL